MTLYQGASVYRRGELVRLDVAIDDGRIVRVEPSIDPRGFDEVVLCTGKILTPGFVDVHVHLREPGFSHKETIATGTLAAARGGYTAVCTMPNVVPPPDNDEHLAMQERIIERDALVRVYPYGTLTVGRMGIGEPTDYAAIADRVIGFSDDGSGVQSEDLMTRCMRGVAQVGGIVAAHCEDESMLRGGYVHAGDFARLFGHLGINSMSEWAQVLRDLRISQTTGCRYHVCHISTRESVKLVREAKLNGIDVTCETAPHYLLMTDIELMEHGRFKMNPPIRGDADRAALIEGLTDGTIDMIATDHAPHTDVEKSHGLRGSAAGVVGLETAFQVLYSGLVKTGIMPMEALLERMCDAPRRRFGIPGGIEVGEVADLALIDLDYISRVDPEQFVSKGHATPFKDWEVSGRVLRTVVGGRTVWEEKVE